MEKNEELEIEQRKARLLRHYGASYEGDCASVRNLTQEERRIRKNLHVVEVIRKKKGRKSEKEKRMLEIAENVLGMSRKRKREPEATHENNVSMVTIDQQMSKSVKGYFGKKESLSRGEGFDVLARRVTEDSSVQYLVSWRGIH